MYKTKIKKNSCIHYFKRLYKTIYKNIVHKYITIYKNILYKNIKIYYIKI